MSNDTTQLQGKTSVWDEEVWDGHESPRFDPEEAAAVAANVKEAESMTWAELKAQSESCPI